MGDVLQTFISPNKAAGLPALQAHPWVAVVKDDPFSQDLPRFVIIREGDTIAEIVSRAEFDPIAENYVSARLDDEEIPRDSWGRILPRKDQFLFLQVVPEGDGANKILNSVLTVFVAALAFFFPAFAPLAALALGGGSLLINTLVPPPQQDLQDASPIFQLDGASNRFNPFGAIPLSFGKRRVFPDLGARGYSEVVGDDFFYRLVVVWGPIGIEVENLRAGETPLSDIDGVQAQHRFIESDPHPTLYPSQVFQERVGAALISVADFESRRTISGATQSVLVYGFPGGLGRRTSRGNRRVQSVTILVRFREVITDPVTGAESFGPYTQLTRTFTETRPGEPLFRSINVPFPFAAQWDVETRRVDIDDDVEDDGVFDDIGWEFFDSRRPGRPVAREDVAYSVFRFRGTDETNGRIQTINGDVYRLVDVFPDAVLDQADLGGVTAADLVPAQRSSSPWEFILWAKRNAFEAREPVEDEAINWPSFALAARNARDLGLTYDQYFTGNIQIEDAVAEAEFAALGRAVEIGTQLTAVVDGPQIAPVLLFSDRHVRNVRVVQSYPEQPDAFRVIWNDGEDGDRDREDIIYAPRQSAATARIFRRMQVPGVTNWAALQILLFRTFNNARLQQRRVSIEVPIRVMDASARFGARVSFSAKAIRQGRAGGYIRSVLTDGQGDVTHFILDEAVELVPGEDLAVRFRRFGSQNEVVSALQPLAPVSEIEVTHTVPLAAPIPAALAPEKGDAFQFGVVGAERMDGIVDRFRSIDDEWIGIELIDYAPERFTNDGFVDVPRPPLIDLPSVRLPPALELVSVSADGDNIAIQFQPEEGPGLEAVGFSAWRAHVDDEVSPPVISAYEALPGLSLRDRILIAPPGLAGEKFVFRLAAIGVDGRLGPVLDVDPVDVFAGLPPIDNFSVVAETEAVEDGAARPVLAVSADPVENFQAEHFVVSARRVDDGLGGVLAPGARPPYQQAGFVDADMPTLILRGLVPGGFYEVQAYLRGSRQEAGAPVTAPIVQVPETEIVQRARDAAPGGGLEAVLTGLDNAVLAADLAAADAQDRAEEVLDEALDAIGDTQTIVDRVTAQLGVPGPVNFTSGQQWTRTRSGAPDVVLPVLADDDVVFLSASPGGGFGPVAEWTGGEELNEARVHVFDPDADLNILFEVEVVDLPADGIARCQILAVPLDGSFQVVGFGIDLGTLEAAQTGVQSVPFRAERSGPSFWQGIAQDRPTARYLRFGAVALQTAGNDNGRVRGRIWRVDYGRPPATAVSALSAAGDVAEAFAQSAAALDARLTGAEGNITGQADALNALSTQVVNPETGLAAIGNQVSALAVEVIELEDEQLANAVALDDVTLRVEQAESGLVAAAADVDSIRVTLDVTGPRDFTNFRDWTRGRSGAPAEAVSVQAEDDFTFANGAVTFDGAEDIWERRVFRHDSSAGFELELSGEVLSLTAAGFVRMRFVLQPLDENYQALGADIDVNDFEYTELGPFTLLPDESRLTPGFLEGIAAARPGTVWWRAGFIALQGTGDDNGSVRCERWRAAYGRREALAQTTREVVADHEGRLRSFLLQEAAAGGASATSILRAVDENGSPIAVAGLFVETPDGERYGLAVNSATGRGTFIGDLDVSGRIRVGNGTLPLAVAPFVERLADGEVYAFPVEFGTLPTIVGMRAPGQMENVEVRALGLTVSGFMASVKEVTGGAITSYQTSGASQSGSGSAPDHVQLNPAPTGVTAVDDSYSFTISGSVTVQAFNASELGGPDQVSYFSALRVKTGFHDGSAWIDGPTVTLGADALGVNPTHESGNQSYAFSNRTFTVSYADSLRASGAQTFGVTAESGGQIDTLNRVTFSGRPPPVETPAAGRGIFTIYPDR